LLKEVLVAVGLTRLGRSADTVRRSLWFGGFLRTFGLNLALQAISIVAGVLAARLLSPDGRGALAAIQLMPPVLALLATFGMSQALVFLAAKDRGSMGEVVGSALLVQVVLGVALASLAVPAVSAVLGPMAPSVITFAKWYLYSFLLELVAGPARDALLAANYYRLYDYTRIIVPIITVIGMLLLVMLRLSSARAVACLQAAALFVAVIPPWYLYRRHIGATLTTSKVTIQRLLRFGAPNLLSNLPATATQRFLLFLIGASLNITAVGYLAVAFTWGAALTPLVTAVNIHLYPRMCAAATRSEQARLAIVSLYGTVATVVLSGALMVIATPLLFPIILGQRYEAAVPLAQLLVVSGAVVGINQVFGFALRALGRPGAVAVAEWASLGAVLLGGLAARPFVTLRAFGALTIVGPVVALFISSFAFARVLGKSAYENSPRAPR
jgi:O-antigen/teichoic acid export membrane protein